jgi:hypothetical protein
LFLGLAGVACGGGSSSNGGGAGTCPEGEMVSGSSCVCPSDQVRAANGTCQVVQACTAPQAFDPNSGTCVDACPAGTMQVTVNGLATCASGDPMTPNGGAGAGGDGAGGTSTMGGMGGTPPATGGMVSID